MFRRIGGLEVAVFDCGGHAFPVHAHDEFVLGANAAGRERGTLDGRAFDVSPSDLTLYNPGQLQASSAADGPWRFASLYVEPQTLWRLTGAKEGAMFETAFPRSADVAARLYAFAVEAATEGRDADEVSEDGAILLRDLLALAGHRETRNPDAGPTRMRRVRDQLADALADPPPLAELAEAHGLTPVQLIRAFRRAYGLPPYAWLAQHRISLSRRQLRSGRPIAEIAQALGFADQPHFTRRFRQIAGMTPAAFAAMK
jgi:AraC family chemosensory pili system transcriptional regulator ChpD